MIPEAPGSAQAAPNPTERLGRGGMVEVRALSSPLCAREEIAVIFSAVWPLIFPLRKPWLEAAPGKALDGTRARGYRIWAPVSPSSASPRTGKVPSKTGKRASGCEKTNFCFIFLTLLGLNFVGHTLSMQPASIPRQGKAKEIKSSRWDTEIKLTSCDFDIFNHW